MVFALILCDWENVAGTLRRGSISQKEQQVCVTEFWVNIIIIGFDIGDIGGKWTDGNMWLKPLFDEVEVWNSPVYMRWDLKL